MKSKLLFLSIFLFSGTLFFSQEMKNYTENGIVLDGNYYGLPLEGKIGYKYRKNDFSFSPYSGVVFDVKDSYSLNAIAGIDFIYRNFQLENRVYYELLPSFTKNNYNFVTYQIAPAYTNDLFSIKLPVNYGHKKFYKTDNTSFNEDFFSGKAVFNTHLIDNGIVRVTGFFEIEEISIFNRQINYYTVFFSLPCTFYLSTFDFGIKYDFSLAHELSFENINPTEEVRISFPYSKITKRFSFAEEDKDNEIIHSLEFEQRFYPFRIKNLSSNFFLSLFENIGFSLKTDGDWKILYQYGLGLGYNLYDSVPFTMQLGLNQDNKFILFIGVISNINHRP
ncbi:MAG: hypothetical protein SOT46_09930 [Treponema sp.]|nr:hypothetical protein [Treponema sp.]MDY5123396.1 hypothetical protein [Treponema sp.]